jgi:peptide deformylase
MKRSIILYPDPRLKQKSHPVVKFDEALALLAADMMDTMRDAAGLGLAAIQVGESLDFMVMDPEYDKDDKGPGLVLANPVLLSTEGSQYDEEGCLSLPDVRIELERAYRVTVKAQDLTGREVQHTFEGILARCILHEIDHMNGKLFIERLPAIKRLLVRSRLKELQKQYHPVQG